MKKENILILCTHNSARSQMAEGFFKRDLGHRFDVFSAGTQPTEVHPLAIEAMKEVGIDISGQTSKGVDQFLGKKAFRYVVSVCEQSSQQCPRLFPGAFNILHWPFEDPSSFEGSREEKLNKFRNVRDQIQRKMEEWSKSIP